MKKDKLLLVFFLGIVRLYLFRMSVRGSRRRKGDK